MICAGIQYCCQPMLLAATLASLGFTGCSGTCPSGTEQVGNVCRVGHSANASGAGAQPSGESQNMVTASQASRAGSQGVVGGNGEGGAGTSGGQTERDRPSSIPAGGNSAGNGGSSASTGSLPNAGTNSMSSPCVPVAEACDELDNDCDSKIDEGVTRPCGNAVPPCKQGMQLCVHGAWSSECLGENKSDELCDGADNDCNGVADDGGDSLCAQGKKCSGTAGCVECRADSDCADRTAGMCKMNFCDLSQHRCSQKDAETRSPCSTVPNGKCDRGQCVACIDRSDCPGAECGPGSTCVKIPACGDGIVDPGEQCDDQNASDNDACTSACKTNACGDMHWRSTGTGAEACDIGDKSTFPDGRLWDTWSCSTQCTRRFIYAPCENRQQSGTPDCADGYCYPDGYCYQLCKGSPDGATCPLDGLRTGVCLQEFCWPVCSVGSDCPPRSPCNSRTDSNGVAHSVCDFPI